VKSRKCLASMGVALMVAFGIGMLGSGQPQYGGTFVMGNEGDVNYMNPAIWISTLDQVVNGWLYDQLIIIGEDGSPEPQLAKTWDISEDGKTFTFYLKEDVKWHDGEQFTARDVAFTVYAILAPHVTSNLANQFSALVGYEELVDAENPAKPGDLEEQPIEVVDDFTVRFHLKYADPTFLAIGMDLGIIPAHLLQAGVDAGEDLTESEFNQQPVGCGPFKFVEWKRDERIVFEAFEDYHGGRPYLDTIVYTVVPDFVVLDTMLESGDVDFVRRVQEADLERLRNVPHVHIESRATIGYGAVVFNTECPQFSDRRVRAAINYAVDVESMVHTFISQEAVVSSSPFSPMLEWGYNPALQPYPHDKGKAVELLREAGWEIDSGGVLRNQAGEPFRFTLNTFDFSTPRKQSCVFIQEELAQIGMQVDVEFLATPVLLSNTQDGSFDAAFVAYGGKADPDNTARAYETANIGIGNNTRYSNPYYDMLVAEARATMDQGRRQELYWKAAEILHDDAPALWAYHSLQHHGYDKKFKGWVFTPDTVGMFKRMHLVYIEEDE